MSISPLTPPKINIADLAKIRRNWSSLLPVSAGDGDAAGRLEEVASFGANPGMLRMLRFVPQALPAHAPLVVVLHGCTQTAAGFDAGTGWSTLAERHGFALLFPEQRRANNAHTCFNWFEPGDVTRGQGEVASIRSMVAHMIQHHRLDSSRVFVTGLSAGGAMTSALLATYPDVFAAGAIIAGLPYRCAANAQEAMGVMYHPTPRAAPDWGALVREASPQPQRKPIVSIWQGDADTTVTPANALEVAKQWCDVHGLPQTQGVEDKVDGVLHRSWRDAGGTIRVDLYVVSGMGHGVPIAPDAGGDRGVGHAMPFVLDAGVSSTWRIARSWGLVPEEAAQARPPRAHPAATMDAQGLVARTLRSFGLT